MREVCLPFLILILILIGQSWLVGTPRRGVRPAQRANPANPSTPTTGALLLIPSYPRMEVAHV